MTKKHLCTFDPSCFIFPFENKFSINIAINSCNLKLILINQTISDNLFIILNSLWWCLSSVCQEFLDRCYSLVKAFDVAEG